jgi:hypothetical protein
MIDSAQYASVWNDRWLKEYATALIKKNWGSNLSKFQGVQLPGGVMLNGQQIYNDAVEEIKALEEEMSSKYELPVDFYLN